VKRLLDGVIEHSHMRKRNLRAGRTRAAARHPAGRTSGSGKTAMARALSGESKFRSSPSMVRNSIRVVGRIREGAARSFSKKREERPPASYSSTPLTRSRPSSERINSAATSIKRILSQLLREIDNLRDVKVWCCWQPPIVPRRSIPPCCGRALRLHTAVRKAQRSRPCRHHAPVLPARAVGRRRRFLKTRRPDRRLTGADIERLSKKATLMAIVEFQDGTRPSPFIVLRSDFLSVLESDRGNPNQSKSINEPGKNTVDSRSDTSTNLSSKEVDYELTELTVGMDARHHHGQRGPRHRETPSPPPLASRQYAARRWRITSTNPIAPNCPTAKYCRVRRPGAGKTEPHLRK